MARDEIGLPEGFVFEEEIANSELPEGFVFEEEVSSPSSLRFLNKSIAQGLGFPVDIVSAGLGMVGFPIEKPFLGSENIEDIMSVAGVELPAEGELPVTTADYISKGVGDAAGMLLPLGGAAKGLQYTKGALGNISREALSTLARTPIASIATELASGAGAGIGEQVADVFFPDNELAKILLQLGGGAGAIGLQQALTLPSKVAKKALTKSVFPFTKQGGTIRAEKRIKELVISPEEAIKSIKETNIANLTPAQKTAEPRLLALEKKVLQNDVKLEDAFKVRTEENRKILADELKNIVPGGDAVNAVDFVNQRVSKLKDLAQFRANQAFDLASQKITNLSPFQKKSEASKIVRQELEDALKDARMQERDLWTQVPKDTVVNVENTVRNFFNILKDTPIAQREDIPAVARKLLTPGIPKRPQGEFIPLPRNKRISNVNQLQGLRSKLLEEARVARSAGNFNKARISEDIAESILDDMTEAVNNVSLEASNPLQNALDFSRTLNQTFKQGEIGKILRAERVGGAAIAPELTLDRLIGAGNEKGGVNLEALLKASNTPETKEGVKQFLLNQFNQSSIKDGAMDVRSANKFIESNKDILDNFPDLKSSIMEASKASERALRAANRTQAIEKGFSTPQKGAASTFLNAPVEKEFERIINSKNPRQTAQQLKKIVSRDATGNAQKGLKSAAIDYLIDFSKKGAFDESGEKILSGNNILGSLKDPRINGAISEVLSDAEINRLKKIAIELRKIDSSKISPLGRISEDTPSQLLDLMARTLGARTGAKFGQGGSSLVTAGFFSKNSQRILDNLTKNTAEKILSRAIIDPDLMIALLANTTSSKGQREAARRLNAWAASLTVPELEELTEDNNNSNKE